jgi:acetyltransferase-like isoleucine patch superfamily enzyme
VGEKCILGACTVVKRNVESFSIVKTDTNNTISIQIGEDNIENKLLFKKNVR